MRKREGEARAKEVEKGRGVGKDYKERKKEYRKDVRGKKKKEVDRWERG